jgi:putative nucleotidyltransferase with HDIG domain
MRDRSSGVQNFSELKFSREQGYFDKSLLVRAFITLLTVLSLFIVLHFRDIRVEIFEIDTKAPSYVVSQVDFDFYDDEATVILRQQAVRDIGKIYKLSDKEVSDSRIEFENFLIYNQDWRNQISSSTFDNMYTGAAVIENKLADLKFTDPRTLSKIKEVRGKAENTTIYTPPDVDEEVMLPEVVWQYVEKTITQEHPELYNAIPFILAFYEEKPWRVEEDIPSQEALRRKIGSQVPQKYNHVRAGSRIIDQGEKVTPRHIAMLQAMKKALGENKNLWHPFTILGSLIMSLLLTIVCAAYFKINHPQILASNRRLFLVVSIIVLTLALAKAVEFVLLTSNNDLIETVRYPLFVPFASILLCALMNPAIATFAAGFLTILLTMTLTFDRTGFMIINLAAGVVAVLTTHSLKRRKEIFEVCFKAYLACIAVILSIHLYDNTFWKGAILNDVIVSAVFMFLTAILVVGLLPLLESAFKVMTDVTLMEYMDPNNDILRRLTIEAPGTYQHSVVVGNLAEAAATAVGANGLFCRVATLYHDIGKMATPQYFTENQQGGMNLHQLLTPRESAEVIIAHVPEGVAIARQANLPEQFVDIIKEHHGTTLVYYFYRKALDQAGGDKAMVDQSEFRYAGPKPRSKESAIIMIADTLEAASRSLDKVNEESLTELANRLIREKAEDGQFDECLLTFEELAIVKDTLIKTLVAYGHSRIKYPKKDSLSQKDEELLSSEA